MSKMVNAEVGVVCAIKEEFVALVAKLSESSLSMINGRKMGLGYLNDKKIVVMETGIGLVKSAAATTWMLMAYQPKVMLFSGIAGSLDANLNMGDVLLGEKVFQAEAITHEQLREKWELPPLMKQADKGLVELAESLADSCPYAVKSGVIVSTDHYPAPANYESFFREYNAQAIDMETSAFYQCCQDFDIPCLCIRSFSNPVTNSEHEEIDSEHLETSSSHASDFCFRLIKAWVSNEMLLGTPSGAF